MTVDYSKLRFQVDKEPEAYSKEFDNYYNKLINFFTNPYLINMILTSTDKSASKDFKALFSFITIKHYKTKNYEELLTEQILNFFNEHKPTLSEDIGNVIFSYLSKLSNNKRISSKNFNTLLLTINLFSKATRKKLVQMCATFIFNIPTLQEKLTLVKSLEEHIQRFTSSDQGKESEKETFKKKLFTKMVVKILLSVLEKEVRIFTGNNYRSKVFISSLVSSFFNIIFKSKNLILTKIILSFFVERKLTTDASLSILFDRKNDSFIKYASFVDKPSKTINLLFGELRGVKIPFYIKLAFFEVLGGIVSVNGLNVRDSDWEYIMKEFIMKYSQYPETIGAILSIVFSSWHEFSSFELKSDDRTFNGVVSII